MQEILRDASYTHSHVIRPVSADALDPKERSCCICYQPFQPTTLAQGGSEVPVQLPCGHTFGKSCIFSWTLANNSCPLCRRHVFDLDDEPANRHFSTSRDSSADRLYVAHQDDIWLDFHVRESSAEIQLRETVGSIDIDLLELYSSDRSTVYPDSQSQTSDGRPTCAEHQGSCQCIDEEDTRAAVVPHECLTSATETEDLDLTELGAQFANLDCHYKQWMNDYLKEPAFEESFFVT